MNRRSFMSWLGLAPIAAVSAPTVATATIAYQITDAKINECQVPFRFQSGVLTVGEFRSAQDGIPLYDPRSSETFAEFQARVIQAVKNAKRRRLL